ncbi:MFS transporter [Acidiferrobacter sp.]|uniref:MFS transporter n=1 Tax=Acidiferrobacter sp. TaxID=1872107 RepID=UPI002609CC75|nr:MFS transporter [Acidiferrobacter sp.]
MSTVPAHPASADAPAGRSPAVPLLGLAWLHFLNDGAANFLPGILPAILVSLHTGAASASGIMAALLIGQGFQPLAGLLSDHLGGKTLTILGVSGTTLGLILVGQSSRLPSLLAALALIGVSNALFHPQSLALARSLAQKRHGAIMSVFLIGGELGRGLYPLIASLAVARFTTSSLWIVALPAVISIPFIVPLLPSLAARPADAIPIQWRRHARPAATLIAYASLRSFGLYALVTYLPIIWQHDGGSLVGGASLITVLLVVGVIGNLSGGLIADRLGRRIVLVGSGVLTAALITLYLMSFGWVLWVILGLLGITLFAAFPVSVLVGQDIFPENRSLGSGIVLGLGNSLGALFLLGFGAATSALGVHTALWILPPVALACAFLATRLSHPSRSMEAPSAKTPP